MDFILPPTLPADGIPWEKVLPPLIPRLSGTHGQYNWSPKLLMPEADNTSAAEVGDFFLFFFFFRENTSLNTQIYLAIVFLPHIS